VPTKLLTRIDWGQIYPPFRDKCFDLAAACQARGVDYYATSGFRSPAEQLKLWQQGRDAKGAVIAPGKVVTQLKFGLHNVGIAVDWTKDGSPADGLQPVWKLEDYRVLAEEAVKLGLEAGFNWSGFKDGPHVQLPISSKNITVSMLRGLALGPGGRASAWGLLDRNWA
jgi:peptidoglycan L-alanyl-D-glutamate endopeptidase CwlK